MQSKLAQYLRHGASALPPSSPAAAQAPAHARRRHTSAAVVQPTRRATRKPSTIKPTLASLPEFAAAQEDVYTLDDVPPPVPSSFGAFVGCFYLFKLQLFFSFIFVVVDVHRFALLVCFQNPAMAAAPRFTG